MSLKEQSMGLEVIARFFRTMPDDVLREVFGADELTEIFNKYDDETIKIKVEDFVRKLYDNAQIEKG